MEPEDTPKHPYYRYPVVVYGEGEHEDDETYQRYRIEDVEGDEFFVPDFKAVMTFLEYHGCYGVTEERMTEIRQERAAAK